MAVTPISSPNVSFSLNGVQSANQRETRDHQLEQRSQKTVETRRTDDTARADRTAATVQKRVEKNTDAQRTRAQANDDAATLQRRDAQQADQRADTERRAAAKSTIGSRINTTA